MIVRLSGRAEREMIRIDTRWRSERRSAPDLFRDELNALFDLLATAPEMGVGYGTWQGMLVRRVLLGKSDYHVYYATDQDTLVIVSVWGARRGSGPRLGSKP